MFQLCRESIRLVLYFQEGSTSIYYQEVIMEINVTSFYIHISDTFYIQYQTRPNVCECDRFRIEISDIVSLVNLLLVFSLSVVYLSVSLLSRQTSVGLLSVGLMSVFSLSFVFL